VRRLTAWIGGTAVGIAAYRLLKRRPQAAAPESAPAEPDDRADELREKLAESRAAEPVGKEDPVEPEPEAKSESPEERRQRVHEEGRATLDDMKPE
jgi:hypothetical protein